MRTSAFVVLAAAIGVSLLPGCAPEDGDEAGGDSSAISTAGKVPLRFAKNVVNVDDIFSNSVRAEDDRLVVPTSKNRQMLAKIRVGVIVAGNRDMSTTDLTKSKNAYGFLRRVKGIKVDGANTILLTDHAELDEWIEQGDLDFSSKTQVFKTTNGADALSIEPLDGQGSSSGAGAGSSSADSSVDGPESKSADGKFALKPFVRLSNSSFKLNATHDGYFRIRKTAFIPRGVDFRSHLVLDPTLGADITVGIAVGGPPPPGDVPGTIPLWDHTWRVNTVPIPIGGPIPITVRFSPELRCKVEAGGVVSATVHGGLTAHGEFGFEGQASLTNFDMTDLSKAPSASPTFKFVGAQGHAKMEAECTLYAVASLMLLDTAGLEGKVGPKVTLNSNACVKYDAGTNKTTTAFNLYETHEFVTDFTARVQLPVVGVGKDWPLKGFDGIAKSGQTYFVGNANLCK